MAKETPRVWVGCLACYNGGGLVGEWVDAIAADEVTVESLHSSANVVTEPWDVHEELWCMDHENFHGLLSGECSPMEAQRIAEIMESFTDGPIEALGAYVSWSGASLEDAVRDFSDHYNGEWDSEKDFAYSLADDMGFDAGSSWPGSYIDWDAATRDLFMDYAYIDGYVFRQ